MAMSMARTIWILRDDGYFGPSLCVHKEESQPRRCIWAPSQVGWHAHMGSGRSVKGVHISASAVALESNADELTECP